MKGVSAGFHIPIPDRGRLTGGVQDAVRKIFNQLLPAGPGQSTRSGIPLIRVSSGRQGFNEQVAGGHIIGKTGIQHAVQVDARG